MRHIVCKPIYHLRFRQLSTPAPVARRSFIRVPTQPSFLLHRYRRRLLSSTVQGSRLDRKRGGGWGKIDHRARQRLDANPCHIGCDVGSVRMGGPVAHMEALVCGWVRGHDRLRHHEQLGDHEPGKRRHRCEEDTHIQHPKLDRRRGMEPHEDDHRVGEGEDWYKGRVRANDTRSTHTRLRIQKGIVMKDVPRTTGGKKRKDRYKTCLEGTHPFGWDFVLPCPSPDSPPKRGQNVDETEE